MRIHLIISLAWVLFLVSPALSQVPVATHVEILKAEDSRTYDAKLKGLLSSPNAAIRERAALAAGRIGDVSAVSDLIKVLEGDRSEKVREMAAFALGEIESIEAAEAIRIAIGETGKPLMPGAKESVIRGRLAEAAGKIAAANAKDSQAKELGQAILFTLEAEYNKGGAANKQIVIFALTALLRARPHGTDVAVARFLEHADGRVRADAANVLARLRAKNANLVLRKMLYSDLDPTARANAARALGAAEDKEAHDLLLAAAVNGDDARVRVSAIRALATLRDARSADKLLTRGEALFAAYKRNLKPNFIPSELSEFIEISNALGQILVKTGNERAIALSKEFAVTDQLRTPEPYLARVKIGGLGSGAGMGDGNPPQLTGWRQYSTLAQVIGEIATYESETDQGKKIKAEAPEEIRKLTVSFINADATAEPEAVLAAPDALRAFARFKTEDLGEVLRAALKNKDVFVRATAAELISELPLEPQSMAAVINMYLHAADTDLKSNDAILAALDALVKFDPSGKGWDQVVRMAAGHPDHLVRQKVVNILPADLKNAEKGDLRRLIRYSGRGTKNGQVLSTDVDYRRAITRKNGGVRAIFNTQKGSFTIELLPEDAPLTVDNFVKLARSGYFNGREVHRVVPNFVMQDGDPIGNGSGGPGWTIRCEVNTVMYERGMVGMALSGKDTGGSQWFVTHSPQPHLDGGYTVFGRVNETGMKVVDKIVRGDKIVSVRVVEGGSRPKNN